jgi:LmbE family N-acetylglucosaminyl deacetylase
MGKILFIGAHTDDVEFGCGGTIAKMIERGEEVSVAALSWGSSLYPEMHLDQEFQNSMQIFGVKATFLGDYQIRLFPLSRHKILQHLLLTREQVQPDVVFFPSVVDIHQDHQTVYQESLRAFKRVTHFNYELFWNCPDFHPQYYVELSEENFTTKVRALECYVSQKNRDYFDLHKIRVWAEFRGAQVGKQLAEAFEVGKLLG